jgi:hypothetical protein
MSTPHSKRRNTLVSLVTNENAAWLTLFLPALFYFVSTRLTTSLGLFRSSTVGDVLSHELEFVSGSRPCLSYHNQYRHKNFLYLSRDCGTLQYPIYAVLQDPAESIVATTWKEDKELGRGYLLLSSGTKKGKIFQWETGGGPIAIGRTLHLNDAGCRSNLFRPCDDEHVGSGGIAVDMTDLEKPRLMVAEYGEGRVIRLEENGARTPLVIQTTTDNKGRSRLCEPFRLLMTPHRDLMIMDDVSRCSLEPSGEFQLWKVPKVTDIPGLASLAVSRKAHAWTKINGTSTGEPSLFFHSPSMGGMTIDATGHAVLITTFVEKEGTNSVVVVRMPLEGESDEVDESNDENQSGIVLDYSQYATKPGAIEIDNHGNLFLAVNDGIVVVSKEKDLIAKVAFSTNEPIVDLTVGSDKFLYISTKTELMRFRIPGMPLVIDKETLLKHMM